MYLLYVYNFLLILIWKSRKQFSAIFFYILFCSTIIDAIAIVLQ